MNRVKISEKSSLAEIRERFDSDVDRFSRLETGQTATIDAKLAMEVTCKVAASATPEISQILDIGCGAGNYSLQLMEETEGPISCHLSDLSQPMLDRARERVSALGRGPVQMFAGDFRTLDFPEGSYDVILAAAVLHHLRDSSDWENAFQKLYRLLRPGGGIWIVDLVHHSIPTVQNLMWERYGEYLESLGGPEYRQKVFAYIEKEDSPRPLLWQLDLLKKVGFQNVEVLHKNSCFAAFGGIRS
ncbi:class I SAM-dependent methyltransferase [Puniceicoccus vermicola]|uniref:Class I SAM-dependent methyltransferase n=1 Tax=Puniceicoccus vermicola TaxID=388746 RepID=A0A7X1B0Y7_9BACT|nr:class I SAM-dependent methyltransferase [Puniceicoccus vermicola]MBC2603608.1 class I SAM-dependent methyltransferase [Puniceicoccus vermicola]